MAFKVELSAQFEHDYRRITEYLTYDCSSPRAAQNLVDEIDRVISVLEHEPFINAVSQKPYLAALGFREHFLRNYLLVYRIQDETVTIIRLLHQSQQYDDDRYWEE